MRFRIALCVLVHLRRCRVAFVALFCLRVLSAEPAAGTETPRPRIGVAFAGGGALGLAHIGVLKWFEEHRIPIDYIAGTSMGGLVGGVYATGMRPADITEFVSGIDWDKVLRGQTSFEDLAYRRKEDLRAYPNSMQFGLRHGVTVPGGLNTGQSITFLLDRVALPYSDLKSFDQLPIPFRCVATDLVTGERHVFKEGPLGQALRSTMSLPAFFTPVKSGKTLYADGGLLDNLPVDVVKAMGADIVIAVYLSETPFDAAGSQSMFSVMGRSIGVMISANEFRSMQMADLVISVDVSGFASMNYHAASDIIPRGYQGAEQKSTMLSRLALDEVSWREYIAQREAKRIHTVPVPQFVDVTGLPPSIEHGIDKDLAKLVGQPVDTDQLEQDISVISGSGRYSSFSYAIGQKDGEPGLVIHGNEKEYGPPFLNLGIVVDGSQYDNVLFTAKARITTMDIGGFGSEWRTDVSVGSMWGLDSEFYKPLSPTTKWFISPHISMSNNLLDLYSHNKAIANYRVRQIGGGFDFGYAFDRFSQLRFGYETGLLHTSLDIGASTLPTPAGRVGVSSIRYNLDRLDDPLVARSGEIVNARMQWNDAVPGAPHGFPLSNLYFGIVRPVSRPASVFLQTYGGTTFGHNDTGLPQFFLGGWGRLNAYGSNELRADQYFLFRLGYEHEVFQLSPLIGNKAYATAVYEVGKVYGIPNQPRLPTDVAVGLVLETFIGPVAVGASAGDNGHYKWYFGVGRVF